MCNPTSMQKAPHLECIPGTQGRAGGREGRGDIQDGVLRDRVGDQVERGLRPGFAGA